MRFGKSWNAGVVAARGSMLRRVSFLTTTVMETGNPLLCRTVSSEESPNVFHINRHLIDCFRVLPPSGENGGQNSSHVSVMASAFDLSRATCYSMIPEEA